ncbi:MAG: hypothetical protein U1F52_00545 [Burkholderiales bacterium]
MSVVVDRQERDGILVLTVSGVGVGPNADVIADACFQARRASTLDRMLVDIRALEGRLSYPETYFFMRRLQAEPQPGRTAILEREDYRDWASFHEATSANAGYRLRYFFDLDEATAWLRS